MVLEATASNQKAPPSLNGGQIKQSSGRPGIIVPPMFTRFPHSEKGSTYFDNLVQQPSNIQLLILTIFKKSFGMQVQLTVDPHGGAALLLKQSR